MAKDKDTVEFSAPPAPPVEEMVVVENSGNPLSFPYAKLLIEPGVSAVPKKKWEAVKGFRECKGVKEVKK